jgi:hypothetical protein
LKGKAANPEVKYNTKGDKMLYKSGLGFVRSSNDTGALFGEFKL